MRTLVFDGVCGNGAMASAFYDSQTNMAFGPMFANGRESRNFLSFLSGLDPASLSWGEAGYGQELYNRWLAANKPSSVPLPVLTFENDVFAESDVFAPNPDDDRDRWTVIADLSLTLFPLFLGYNNSEIADILVKHEVLKVGQNDSERSCFYGYFETEADAREFIDRLNAFLTRNWRQDENAPEVNPCPTLSR